MLELQTVIGFAKPDTAHDDGPMETRHEWNT